MRCVTQYKTGTTESLAHRQPAGFFSAAEIFSVLFLKRFEIEK